MTEPRTRQVPSQQETVEPAPLLETKLYVPRSPRALVPRPRLRELMDRGATSRLMLVSAPAGFGKTTVLAEWLAASLAAPTDHRSVAWLSLDPSDNHPGSFWTYVIAALRSAAPGVGASALALLHAAQPPPIETVLTTLVNDLGAVANDVVLVLDDYHVIDARDVQEGMAFLLDHLPAQLHLVIGSRADPALPLARLRVRGELVEIRAADLRFTPDEAAAYLNGVMGLVLTARDVAALEGRTEGWIAALQMAALSMQGRDDVAGFIAGFAGDDRYVVDYPVEEVLQRQPDRVHTFLLQTSILGRLSGPLCDAVTGQDGGKAMLEALDRGNLFLVPLDDRRRWYRYHHLFADVLRARLLDEQPDLLPDLHRRASDWTSRTVNGPSPSSTRWPPRISSERRTWSSWPSRRYAGIYRWLGRTNGFRRCPTRCCTAGQCSAWRLPGRYWRPASSRPWRRAFVMPNDGWTRRSARSRNQILHRLRWSLSTKKNFVVSRP